jgi:hypothetical protein
MQQMFSTDWKPAWKSAFVIFFQIVFSCYVITLTSFEPRAAKTAKKIEKYIL